MNRHKPKHAYYSHHRLLYLLPIAFTIYLLLLRPHPPPPSPATATTSIRLSDPCSGRYIYIHALPPRFNSDILHHCRTLSNWTDMCLSISNSGLGPPLPSPTPAFFATDQFSLDLIFHHRMLHHPCLTPIPSLASAVFVPFYAGLDLSPHLFTSNASARDAASLALTQWLSSQSQWAKMHGHDHFLVAGRTTWDFRRLTDQDTDWGNKLLLLPEVKNMTVLVLESSPWDTNDVAIPYPTYFHPKDATQVSEWQERMRRKERKWLFSFAGAARANGTPAASIRERVIKECRESVDCVMVECDGNEKRGCYSPEKVMEVFENSVFCLQPPGDTYTRRSAFDAMVAGCIPVFFHPRSGHEQYVWHLGREYGRYSVMVKEEEVRRLEEVLRAFGEEEVKAMREEVIRMMPGLVYGDPRGVVAVRDAFDVAVEAVVERVRKRRDALLGKQHSDA